MKFSIKAYPRRPLNLLQQLISTVEDLPLGFPCNQKWKVAKKKKKKVLSFRIFYRGTIKSLDFTWTKINEEV